MSVVSEPRLPSTPRIPDQAQAQDGAELQGGRPFGVKPEVLYGLKESSRLRAVKDWIKQHSLPYRTAIFLKSIPHGIKGLIKGKRGAWDHLKATMSFVTRADRIAGRPINITIEPTNLCNLECPVCETGDTFARDRVTDAVQPGDLGVFRTAGAYGATMASTYNSRSLVPEVLVDGDRYVVVADRIAAGTIMAAERVPDWID